MTLIHDRVLTDRRASGADILTGILPKAPRDGRGVGFQGRRHCRITQDIASAGVSWFSAKPGAA